MENTKDTGLDQATGPPLLTGGVLQGQGSLISAGCDWVTINAAASYVDPLLDSSVPAPDLGSAYHKGYTMHEHRRCLGGCCRRHWSPITKSKNWGKHYESWVFSGQDALIARDLSLKISEGNSMATRIDCAFDFATGGDTTPEEIREGWADVWRSEKRMSPGISGQGGPESHSVYIGSATSDRRIRIYRKDIESPWLYPGGRVMRVEIVLKGKFARAAYWQLRQGTEAMVRYSAGQLFEMTGFQAVADVGEIPLREVKPRTKLASALAAMVDQWADILHVIDRADLDIAPLIERRIAQSSRMALTRRKRRLKEAREHGASEIVAAALEILSA